MQSAAPGEFVNETVGVPLFEGVGETVGVTDLDAPAEGVPEVVASEGVEEGVVVRVRDSVVVALREIVLDTVEKSDGVTVVEGVALGVGDCERDGHVTLRTTLFSVSVTKMSPVGDNAIPPGLSNAATAPQPFVNPGTPLPAIVVTTLVARRTARMTLPSATRTRALKVSSAIALGARKHAAIPTSSTNAEAPQPATV